ncbi:uncharacterized protein LOC108270092 isoform X2 [Ictalurus punctatus]|uniref:non-specific serine/threonine protein kinase n=1 Tax=Ictalurus punctatus TaxID=7998 RepID=A0A2D0RN27_ICTPU|nr:uncharacterized protein LOC108270092 isoform X2 [Ictalurus punctatus]
MLDLLLINSPCMDTAPQPTEGPGKPVILCDTDYLCDQWMSHHDLEIATFPGPLLSKKMKKEDLLDFIRRRTHECLIKDDIPDQQAAYVFWLIMEKFCTQNGNVMMTDITPLLWMGYSAYKNKLGDLETEDHWCLLLARRLSNSNDAEDELRESVIKIGDTLASRGQIYPAHVCYVVAQVELDSYNDRTSFSLIGSGGLPFGKSAMREAFERTEVYEYALWLNSGFTQPNFQIFKLLHARRLADSGHSAQARNYCRTIATAVATFPSNITVILMSRLIRLSEELYRGKAKEPNWLVNLRYLCLHKVEQIPGKDYIIPEQQEVWDVDSQSQGLLTAEKFTLHLTAMELQAEMWDEDSDSDGSLMPETSTTYVNTSELQPEVWDVDSEVQEMPTFHPSCLKFLTEPEAQRFLALYTVGDMLGSGGFGTVYEGTCKKDGQQVAIKYIAKDASDFYIPIPGESCKLLLEVALMQIVSKPPHNKNVLQLLDWFDMPDCFLLVLERPVPCMDVYNLCMSQKGVLDEPLAKIIMRQVVEAARYCHNRGVFHRDIKAENLLFNTDTMEVKLIDFGCGDLWQDTPYEEYAGTPDFWPPEWILQQEYNAYPATVWSLGILLFSIVCGEMPFMTDEEVVAGTLQFKPGLSKACHHLIEWCLEQDPNKRPSLQQISEHEWFTEDL